MAAVLGTVLLIGAAIVFARPRGEALEAATAEMPRAQAVLGPAVQLSDRVAREARRAEEVARWRSRYRDAQAAHDMRATAAALSALAPLDPTVFRDRDVAAAAVAAAIRLAFEEDAAAGDLFESFGDAGADGADILYEIASTRGGSKGAKRANDVLTREAVRAHASRELSIALDLRDARCDAKRALFERAGLEGDVRTYRLLERLRAPDACTGTGQCCYGGSPSLERAIDAVRRRF
jgi:hypothetical protein